jgi:hypothetical protein
MPPGGGPRGYTDGVATRPRGCEASRMRLGPVLAALTLLVSAAPAVAGTATLVTGREGSVTTARVAYDAAPGESGVSVRVLRGDDFGDDRFEGGGLVGFLVSARGVTPGPGCEVLSVRYSQVGCPVPAGAQLRGPVVHAGDRADAVTVSVPAPGTQIFGGPGADIFWQMCGAPQDAVQGAHVRRSR